MGSKHQIGRGHCWALLMLVALALPVQAATYLRFADEAGTARFESALPTGRFSL